jgi:hypothetical protein
VPRCVYKGALCLATRCDSLCPQNAPGARRRELLLDAGICFCYSTAFSASGPYLSELSMTFGLGLREGARVITVDKMLLSDGPWEYREVGALDAKNAEVGMSTGYVYEVVKSPNGGK